VSPWSSPGIVDLTVAERIEALAGQGLAPHAIAAELGVSLRTLQRVRAALRQPSKVPSPAAKRARGRGDRTKWLQVRLSKQEHAELSRLAAIVGVPVGEYVRSLIWMILDAYASTRTTALDPDPLIDRSTVTEALMAATEKQAQAAFVVAFVERLIAHRQAGR
jgi:hypothetical protein